MWLLVISISAILWTLLAAGQAAQPSACQCVDRGDIQERLRQARAAVETYRKQIAVISTQERRTGKPVKLTEDSRQKLQSHVQEALDKVATPNRLPLPTGKTEPKLLLFCVSEEPHPSISPCMKETIRIHEEVHLDACSLTEKWNKTTLIKYAEEEIRSYSAEIKFLEEQLAKIVCDYKVMQPTGILGTLSGLKCDGPEGEWNMIYDWQSGQESGHAEVNIILEKNTLRGVYKLKGQTYSPHQCSGTGIGDVYFESEPVTKLQVRNYLYQFHQPQCGSDISTPGFVHLLEAGDFCALNKK
jgi:hypothetical protein